jgi:hypothetical protein
MVDGWGLAAAGLTQSFGDWVDRKHAVELRSPGAYEAS